jgi:putative CocE/NonD family hydrolase
MIVPDFGPTSLRRSRVGGLRAVLAGTFAIGATLAPFHAAEADPLAPGIQVGDYVGEDVMIPMRDGKKLHAEVWRPKDSREKLPILLQRSPYGFKLDRIHRLFDTEFKQLAADGYIFVLEDIRGRFDSEGDYRMFRPPRASPASIDESTDTFDTIDWAIRTLPDTTGKVGMFGISYLGWTTAMATIEPHPALAAISIQASPDDMFLGDDFHHNGAFRLDYGWEYAAGYETNSRTTTFFDFGADDPYGWFLKQGTLSGLDTRAVGKALPTWRGFVDHPAYDDYWRAAETSALMPAKVAIPDLIVAGWWDQEDFYGPMTIYDRQKPRDPGHRNVLVVGPWNHGGWARAGGDHYGPFALGEDTALYFRGRVEAPWFRYWLKGLGDAPAPGALIFETGSNAWRSYGAWPPTTGTRKRRLYLHAGGGLSFDPPTSRDRAPDRFVSDPANPVPYRERPVSPSQGPASTWPTWLADDQAPFARRPDVLSWETPPLDAPVTVRGSVIARLFASTTGGDADWIVKLIDVYPSDDATPAAVRGRQLIIADEVFRGRFRSGFAHPSALRPGKVLDYSIDLHTASHVFEPGHRIAVQVQSTWFPLIDRNPQIFTANIFRADPRDFKAQTHSVFHARAFPSAIEMDVADATAEPHPGP